MKQKIYGTIEEKEEHKHEIERLIAQEEEEKELERIRDPTTLFKKIYKRKMGIDVWKVTFINLLWRIYS